MAVDGTTVRVDEVEELAVDGLRWPAAAARDTPRGGLAWPARPSDDFGEDPYADWHSARAVAWWRSMTRGGRGDAQIHRLLRDLSEEASPPGPTDPGTGPPRADTPVRSRRRPLRPPSRSAGPVPP
ncbi:hypothetical protein AB0D34_18995 [Streptomyces sp. NPDC048420]|uniref:hypothetical protein n=1 Tax=Streptomyces sp. NPDC048420 TaxID=3155755 RepID=UPI003422E6AA